MNVLLIQKALVGEIELVRVMGPDPLGQARAVNPALCHKASDESYDHSLECVPETGEDCQEEHQSVEEGANSSLGGVMWLV